MLHHQPLSSRRRVTNGTVMMMQGNILQRRPPKRRFLRARAAVALVIVLQGVSLLFVPFNRTATSLQLANNATNTRLSTKLKQSNHLLPIDRSSIRSNDDVQSRKTQRNRKEVAWKKGKVSMIIGLMKRNQSVLRLQ